MINLNLISPQQKDLLKISGLYILVENILGIFLIVAILVAVILIPLNQSLVTLDYQNKKNKEAVLAKNSQVTEKIKALNQRIDDLFKIRQSTYNWDKLLAELSEQVPTGVVLKRLNASLANKLFVINGFAQKREDLIKLIDSLKQSSFFLEVASPLANYLEQNNITFEIKGKLK